MVKGQGKDVLLLEHSYHYQSIRLKEDFTATVR